MTRRFCLLILLLAAPMPAAPGQSASPADAEPRGTYLGALFSPIHEALYDHLPQVPRGQGVLVTHVLPESPAARAALRRNDIVLEYDGRKVRDCEHFARLIQADQPDRKIRLGLVRGGKEVNTDVTLGRGPALKIAPAQHGNYADANVPRATARAVGPAPISVSALPLENERMRVTIEYYQDGTGKLRTVTAEGSTNEIDGEVQKLPDRERGLARRALEQIRALNSPRSQQKTSPKR